MIGEVNVHDTFRLSSSFPSSNLLVPLFWHISHGLKPNFSAQVTDVE